jgi:hypothetical protein
VNAAFLLTTAAWLSGAGEAPAPPAAPAAAPAAPSASAPVAPMPIISAPSSPAPIYSSSGGSCGGACGCADCGCTPPKPSLHDRLKAMFHKKSDCDCGCGCEAPKPVKAPKCETCDPCKPEKKHPFAGLFHKKNECESCSSCGGGYITATPISVPMSAPSSAPAMIPPGPMGEPIGKPKEEPAKPMPDKKGVNLMPQAIDLVPTSSKVEETESQHPFELSRRYESRVERATDYSSITGQLFFVHADGGLWVLRYAPVGQEDQHGGGIILARNLAMESYREGDLVTVHGAILKEKGSMHLGAPLYRANEIQLVDRGQ